MPILPLYFGTEGVWEAYALCSDVGMSSPQQKGMSKSTPYGARIGRLGDIRVGCVMFVLLVLGDVCSGWHVWLAGIISLHEALCLIKDTHTNLSRRPGKAAYSQGGFMKYACS